MNVTLLSHQWDFLTSDKKFLALVAGIGSGKSWTIAHYILGRISKYPKALHFIGANTYGQLRNSTLNAVFGVLNDLEIPFSYNQSTGILEVAGGRVLCKSMENFNALRGIEIGSFILDEVRDLKQEAFDMMMGRLRDKNAGGDLQGRVVSSPSGYNWIFDYFHPSGVNNTHEFGMVHANSYANTFLPDGYIDSIKEQYDEKFFQQEIMGDFVNLTAGKIYYGFNRDINVKEIPPAIIASGGTTYINADFNVGFMAATVMKYVNDTLYVFDEFFLKDSDTFQATAAWNLKYRGATVIPDSTCSNRKTSGISDHEIIRQAGFRILPTYNPFIRDRVNNVNRLLQQGRIVISPKCIHLIEDLEKCVWKGNKEDQTTHPHLSHSSSTLGYGAHKLMPIGVERQFIPSQSR